MSNKRLQRGMTLIELIVAIVIISVGLAGVLSVFQNVVKNSADPMIRKQILAIAEEMMEEITLKPYAAVANAAPAGCARDTYNDISDYNGYSSTGICDLDGTAVAGLANYNVAVTVVPEALADVAAASSSKITVRVTSGAESLDLVGWRTGWAI